MLKLSYLLFLGVLITLSTSCGPPANGDGQAGPDTSSQGELELTKEIIDERINDGRVRDVPPESGTGEPIGWSFDEDEPKEISVVEKQVDGTRATVILDVTTRSSARAREPRQLSGQIKTEWELQSGWVLRRWEIVNVENISMKYKNLPRPTPQNANQN